MPGTVFTALYFPHNLLMGISKVETTGAGPYPLTQTRLERLAREKHSSVLQTFVNYGRNILKNWAPDWIHS
jgi:hypothetical protein